MIEMALKFCCCRKITKITQRLQSLPPSVIRLSCISLFSTELKSANFLQKKVTFGSSYHSLSKILVALLVAFTAADRFFKRLYWPDMKRAKKRCVPYKSLFNPLLSEFRFSS